MTLCHNCDDTRDLYVGNGVQKDFNITFEYYDKTEIGVAYWSDVSNSYEPAPDTDWIPLNATVIRFNEPVAPGQKFIIYRCTDLEELPAEFYPGTSIKAKDLNDNFFVLRNAIQEAACAASENVANLDEQFLKKDQLVSEEEQVTDGAVGKIDDDHVFTTAASAARHDNYVQEDKPDSVLYEQDGKIWNDTELLRDYFWDADIDAWVSFTTSGPAGPSGDYGPPGKVIVSDSPPTEYPAVGSNQARPLQGGDLWFDSYRVLLYVYYQDYASKQWVSVTKPGPVGPKGADGDLTDAPVDGATYGRKDGAWESIDTGVSQIIAGANISISPVDGLGAVTINGTDAGASVEVSETAPSNPIAGDLWWSDNTVNEGGGRLYIYTGDEWVDVSLPGTGANFDQGTADTLYLSKVNDDTAAGEITFEKNIVVDGNVGIGTDSPASKLVIEDNSRQFHFDISNTSYAKLEQRGSSFTALELGSWGDVVLAADTNSGASKSIIFSRQGTQGSYTESMRIDSNGNVGVGTSSPDSLLHLSGLPYVTFNHTGAGANLKNWMVAGGSDGKLRVRSGTDAGVFTNSVTIDHNGSVGIGTDNPQTLFNVRGTKDYSGTSPSETSFTCSIRSNNSNVGIGSYNGIPTIQGSGTGTSYNLALCPANGSVGVGFALPEEKLDVNGNLRVRGNLIVDGTGAGGYGTPNEVLNAIKTVDGAGSGLDADTVDGIQGGSFIRSDANDSVSGIITFNNEVRIRTSLDFADADVLRMGDSDDWTVAYNSNGWQYINQKENGTIFQDNGTNVMRLEDSGVFRPEINNTGQIGGSGHRWNYGYFRYLAGQSSTTPGGGNSSTGYFINNAGSNYFSPGNTTIMYCNRNGTGVGIDYRRSGTQVGRVLINQDSVSYSTNSDYRLKENVVPLDNAIKRVKQLKPSRFNWIGSEGVVDGFIAHEAQAVVPEAVHGEKDGEEYQSIDQSKLIPLLAAALQEAINRIEILEGGTN